MSKPIGYQFIRIQGFPRGAASKRNTVGSILAEGLRHPSHISHLTGPPRVQIDHLQSPLDHPGDLAEWLSYQMDSTQNKSVRTDGTSYFRALRKDALAIGTVIASLPEPMSEFDPDRYKRFCNDTTEWFQDFLSPYELLLHFRIHHFDEEHPHFHLWFTPKGNDQRTFNWSLTSVCGQGRGFYHDLQKRFFEDVGKNFFVDRAKPANERIPRKSRRQAVIERDSNRQLFSERSKADSDLASPINQSVNIDEQVEKRVSERLSSSLENILKKREQSEKEVLMALMNAIRKHSNKGQQLDSDSYLHLILNEAFDRERAEILFEEFRDKRVRMDVDINIGSLSNGQGWDSILSR